MASPVTPTAERRLSDTAMNEFIQLVTDHPEAVTHELNYHGNPFLVVSTPHIVAAIARTAGRPYTEVACRQEHKALFSFISGNMPLIKADGPEKPFWPQGVPTSDTHGEEVTLPSPGLVVKLGRYQTHERDFVNRRKAAAFEAWRHGKAANMDDINRSIEDKGKGPMETHKRAKRKAGPLQEERPVLPQGMTDMSFPLIDDNFKTAMAKYFACRADISKREACNDRHMVAWWSNNH